MSEFWSVFSQYFSILDIIWGAIKTSLLSFIISLVVLIVLKKFVLVRRRYKVLNYLAYSYYFFIPVICLCFGFIYGLIATSRDQVIEKLPLYQSSIQSVIEQNFNFNLEIDNYTSKSLVNNLDDAVTELHSELLTQLNLTYQNHQQTQRFVVMVLNSPIGLSYIKSSLKDKISTTIGLDKQLVNDVFEIKLSQLLTGDTIIKLFSFYIKQMVTDFLITIIIIWVILLLIPLIEIIFAYFYNKKYQMLIEQNKTQLT